MHHHSTQATRLAKLVNNDLVEQFAPAAVLINAAYEILHFQGPTIKFLELS